MNDYFLVTGMTIFW